LQITSALIFGSVNFPSLETLIGDFVSLDLLNSVDVCFLCRQML